MRISFKTRQQHTTWGRLRDVWRTADQIDVFDGGWTFDHFYPIFSDSSGPCLEGWTLLSALAEATERLRLGVMVTGTTYRHPAVLANMIAAVDHVSGGRLDVGLGAGWNGEEHLAYGIPLPRSRERFDRFTEYVEVVHRLLTEAEADYAGDYFTLTAARCEPKPVQRPRPPFVIGGRGERRTLPIVAQWADVWNYPSGPVEDFTHRLGLLRALSSDRHIEASVQVGVDQDLPRAIDESWGYVEAGAEHLVLNLAPEVRSHDIERIASAFRPLQSAVPDSSPNPQRTG